MVREIDGTDKPGSAALLDFSVTRLMFTLFQVLCTMFTSELISAVRIYVAI